MPPRPLPAAVERMPSTLESLAALSQDPALALQSAARMETLRLHIADTLGMMLLEDEFQAELNLPVMCARRCDSPSRIVIGPVLKDRLHVRLAEIGVIEDVEEFGPEREIFILLEVETLEEGKVDIHHPGSDDGVSSYISEEAWNRSAQSQRIRQRESIRIVPVLRSP